MADLTNPTVVCRCSHTRNDHMENGSKCDLCGCSAFDAAPARSPDQVWDDAVQPSTAASVREMWICALQGKTWRASYEAGRKDESADAGYRAALKEDTDRREKARLFDLENDMPPFTESPPEPTPNPYM